MESKTEQAAAKTGIELIAEERKRQVEIEGWTSEHDAGYNWGEMVCAALCYGVEALNKNYEIPIFRVQKHLQEESNFFVNSGDRGDRRLLSARWVDAWPWDKKWDKRDKHDQIKCLQFMGALAAAEIDRLQSLPSTKD
jgi:hypothetical protein